MKTTSKIKSGIVVLGLLSAFFASLGAFFWFVFYVRYWKWRVEIDQAQSSFITPEGDNLISGGMFWAFPAFLFTIAGLVFLIVLLIQTRKPNHVIDPTRYARRS